MILDSINIVGMGEFPIFYAYCECRVWPLVAYNPVGSCGLCGVRPEGYFVSFEDAQKEFEESGNFSQ